MSITGGENNEKQRLKGELMASEIWKERCKDVNIGLNPNPEKVLHTTLKSLEEASNAIRSPDGKSHHKEGESSKLTVMQHRKSQQEGEVWE